MSLPSAASVVAVVLAAGKGTRMKSRRPKVLHEVAGKPLVSWSIDAVRGAGCGEVIVVVGHGAEDVSAVVAARHSGCRTVVQAEQKGTGHAVMMAMPALPASLPNDGVVVVVCGDTPFITAEAIAALIGARGDATMALWTTTLPNPRGYGRIVRDAGGSVCGIVEEKDATDAQKAITETNPGVYAFQVGFLRASLSKLTTANAAGEYYLTDLIKLCVEGGGRVASVNVDAGITDGINDRVQLAAAEERARDLIVSRHMKNGVTFISHNSIFVGSDVVIGEDTVVHPQVSLWGKTTIGGGCVVGQGTVIKDSVVDDGVTINPYSIFEQARVRGGAVVGPFSRLRPDADVGEGAHVGNFVELKKTKLGKGSKANHLAYLGDADIGAGVNVGAGTITCNYDGIGKHKTTLGDGVFVGSNATLVAPSSSAKTPTSPPDPSSPTKSPKTPSPSAAPARKTKPAAPASCARRTRPAPARSDVDGGAHRATQLNSGLRFSPGNAFDFPGSASGVGARLGDDGAMKMHAAVYERYGSPEVVEVVEIERPEPRANEVRIAVGATTVTAACTMMRRGDTAMARVFLGLFRPRRRFRRLGLELCGTVDAVGARVTRFKPGDRVFGFTGFAPGACADFLCLREEASIARAPDGLTDLEAASLVDGATTALYFLRDRARVGKGTRVAIIGASGGIGSSAVQVARHLGATVTAVCSGRNADLVRSLGAHDVVDYTREDVTCGPQRFDVVFDAVGKTTFGHARRCLVDGGVFATAVGGFGAYLLDAWTRWFSRTRFVFGMSVEKRAALADVTAMVREGALRPLIDRRYALAEVRDAHRYVESGRKRGAVVIAIAAG